LNNLFVISEASGRAFSDGVEAFRKTLLLGWPTWWMSKLIMVLPTTTARPRCLQCWRQWSLVRGASWTFNFYLIEWRCHKLCVLYCMYL
jgi:hypothetical protein